MVMKSISPKIVFVSPFTSEQSALSAFTRDLIEALNEHSGSDFISEVCAMIKGESEDIFQPPVSMILDVFDMNSCHRIAGRILNDPSIKMLCVEYSHKYLGDEGSYNIMEFLLKINKPYVVRLHDLPAEPSVELRDQVCKLIAGAEKIMVLTRQMQHLLKAYYQAEDRMIRIVPHGVYPVCKKDPIQLKEQARLMNKKIILRIGQIRRNSCVEKLIEAMRPVSTEFPDALLLIIGKTDPDLYRKEGEKYRNHLQEIIDSALLREHVMLVNESLSPTLLMELLAMADIYMHTGTAGDISVNAELLNAMASGCPVISEPCSEAQEFDGETGILTTGENSSELADEIIYLLENNDKRWELGRNAYMSTRNLSWEAVAGLQLRIFTDTLRPGKVLLPFPDAEHPVNN